MTFPATYWWLALAWMFVLGACVGSFLNVVVYRLPAGQSLLYPPSRCPKCSKPIRPTDNLPIFGWLWLRGRCRNCRATISGRYPVVELTTAALFALLAVLEPLSDGVNLPLPQWAGRRGWDDEVLWLTFVYHATLLCGLLAAAGIEYDGHRLPFRLNAALLLAGAALPFWRPEVRPVASHWPQGFMGWLGLDEAALVDGVAGIAVALLLSCAVFLAARRGPERFDWQSAMSALVWVGLFLGWQAVAALSVLTAGAHVVVGLTARIRGVRERIGWNACLAVSTLVWIIGWKVIVERCPWLGNQARFWLVLAAAALTASLSGMKRVLTRTGGCPR